MNSNENLTEGRTSFPTLVLIKNLEYVNCFFSLCYFTNRAQNYFSLYSKVHGLRECGNTVNPSVVLYYLAKHLRYQFATTALVFIFLDFFTLCSITIGFLPFEFHSTTYNTTPDLECFLPYYFPLPQRTPSTLYENVHACRLGARKNPDGGHPNGRLGTKWLKIY